MKTILEVKNLTKTYGRGDSLVKAVDDVSLTVNEGEFVAIIGASGSGKSTLLHLIGGVDRPDEKKKSEIIIDGTDITKLNDNKLALFRRDYIGIIYQFYNLIPVLTVKENITLPADLAKNDIDEKRLKDLIKNLGLTDRENHLPNQLSGGQQQRTAIGRALYGQPALILADEPTGNLDSKAGEEIVKLLKLANEKYHQTIILVTHDLNIAKEADRVITVADGKIVSDKGTRHERSK
ncbi:ABC transporter ATP-binding protein [Candidatus Saccharibacteria bacterium]|nr:ABC transporter ATP-binding protein [Candidatus Saccharibacteria bacterium]